MASTDRTTRRSDSSRRLWILIVVLLAPAVVVPLLVPLYDRMDPTLFGFPFFFWFQFLLILVVSAITVLAYYLAKLAEQAERYEGE